ncbi:MAG: hypothetical protein KBS59_05545, partial [Clostridiales bacterium]|nr:hypothetical protein [Clostridiales bacterium]
YDVSPFAKEGENLIAVRYFDEGATVNRGFLCHILLDGISADVSWKYHRDVSKISPATRTITRNNEEITDMRFCDTGFENPDFDDARFAAAKLSEIDLSCGERLHQCFTKPQISRKIKSVKIALPHGEKYEKFCFADGTAAVYISKITARAGAKVNIKTASAAFFEIDGERFGENDDVSLPLGEHYVCVFARGTCAFGVCAENAALGEWKAVCENVQTPARKYPWNENIQPYKISEALENALKNPDGAYENAASATPADLSVWNDVFLDSPSEIYDFERECVGELEIDFECDEGAVLSAYTCEMKTRQMGAKSCMRIISRGGRQTFVSDRLRGLKYVYVILPAGAHAKVHSVSLFERRYDTKDVGKIETSDEKINKIYKISTDTAALCMLDTYVDCVGYEQNVWTGDSAVGANVNALSFGEREYDARHLDLIANSMDPLMRKYYRGSNRHYKNDDFLPCACFPTYPDAGIPIWSFTWVNNIYDHYMHYGIDDGFADRVHAAEECLSRAEKHMTSRGLFAKKGAWNLIEWADNDLSPYGEVSANNMMLCGCYTNVSLMLEALEEHEKAASLLEKSKNLKYAINEYLWDRSRGAYVDTARDEYAYSEYLEFCSEFGYSPREYGDFASATRVSVQTATFALLYDICDTEEKRKSCESLLISDMKRGKFVAGTPANRKFEKSDDVVGVGSPFFLYYAFAALSQTGHADIMLEVIRREWGAMLDDGFTSTVETFRRPDGEWGRSAAHAWSAAPAVYLKTEVLGIKPILPGYRKFSVEPHPCGLTSASGAVCTPYGEIRVSWRNENGKILIECSSPDECERM